MCIGAAYSGHVRCIYYCMLETDHYHTSESSARCGISPCSISPHALQMVVGHFRRHRSFRSLARARSCHYFGFVFMAQSANGMHGAGYVRAARVRLVAIAVRQRRRRLTNAVT